MDADQKTIDLFTTRARQMILQYGELKKQNSSLKADIDALKAEVQRLNQELQQRLADYNSLKMARMVEITNGDMETAQKRMAQLIRDVNKCITLISETKQ